ncbi:hypothetical protein SAMN02745181_0683 [Rubritalea squalenifaciens DSM 18772]|uniref:Uncharacterized protein n=2 Tax=Rubritalea squalenifaciens TaxID=407226 RepID=A0A1M6D9Y4_9BACT|nr:hypothetical protein SAMN02745181_0683 [Rubritalea squalenifaciens DSM 18772]
MPFTYSLDDYREVICGVLDSQNITHETIGGGGGFTGYEVEDEWCGKITSEYDIASLEKALGSEFEKAFTNRRLIRLDCEVDANDILTITSKWVVSNKKGDSSIQNEKKNEHLGAESVDNKLKSAKSEALRGNSDAAILVLNHYRYVVHDYEKAYFWGVVVDKLRPEYADNLLAGIRGDIESECFATQEMEGSGTTSIPDIE